MRLASVPNPAFFRYIRPFGSSDFKTGCQIASKFGQTGGRRFNRISAHARSGVLSSVAGASFIATRTGKRFTYWDCLCFLFATSRRSYREKSGWSKCGRSVAEFFRS